MSGHLQRQAGITEAKGGFDHKSAGKAQTPINLFLRERRKGKAQTPINLFLEVMGVLTRPVLTRPDSPCLLMIFMGVLTRP